MQPKVPEQARDDVSFIQRLRLLKALSIYPHPFNPGTKT
ncbi:hypothetical protein SAMN05216361_1420 [Marisediminitalea aggregata]|uniref:Uncharacterized protein n=1 Tax=Marisediminitalea aggregata TaxID=634436 RepID=A0A1M5HCZ4_9ALTE|nr:hypothetical protein SAMN05216361_1420 [Marisediminitalea aggregata]